MWGDPEDDLAEDYVSHGAPAEVVVDDDALRDALKAVESILWMAERYAEAGGSHGIEMEEYEAAAEKIRAALKGK